MFNKLTNTDLNIALINSNLYGGVSYNQEIITGNDFTYGVVCAASIKFTIDNSADVVSTYLNNPLIWECQMAGETTYKRMGKFWIKDIQKNGKRATLTAYDAVSLLDKKADDWFNNLTFPISVPALVSSMATKLGLTINFSSTIPSLASYKIENNAMIKNITYRQMLEYVGQMCNCNFVGSPNEEYDIISLQYAATDKQLNNSNYIKLTMADYGIDPIDKIQVQSTYDDIGYIYGNGTNAYIITQNPLFYSNKMEIKIMQVVMDAYNELKTISYVPMKFTTYKDFGINCGNIISVNGKTALIMKKSISSSGCSFECIGNKRREVQKEESNAAITALNNKTNELTRTVEETKSTITDIETSVKEVKDSQGEVVGKVNTLTTQVSEVKQTADGLTSTVSTIQGDLTDINGELTNVKSSVSTISQKADQIETKVEDQDGTISQLTQTVNGFETRISTAEGNASSAKQTAEGLSSQVQDNQNNISTVSQTASKIDWVVKSGTSASNFTLTDRALKLTADNIDLTGYVSINSLTSSGTTNIDGSRITTGTISADRIDASKIKTTIVYSSSSLKPIVKEQSSTTLYIGGDGTFDYDNVYIYGGTVRLGPHGSTFGYIFDNGISSSSYGTFRPITDGKSDLGASSYGFGNLYINQIWLKGNTKNISGYNNAAFSIGSSTSKATIYVDQIYNNSNTSLLDTSGNFKVSVLTSGSYTTTQDSAALYPSNSTSSSLGKSANYWAEAYIKKLYLSTSCYITAGDASSIKVGTTTIGGGSSGGVSSLSNKSGFTTYTVSLSGSTLAPAATNTYILGSSSKYWKEIHAAKILLYYNNYRTCDLTCSSTGTLLVNNKAV